MIWHWAHAPHTKCGDPWWENEGPWHKEWKSHFPLECQEVVAFDDSGEKHIADIKLPNGLVIELQHSPMASEELASRERFYGNMIWIIDGSRFAKNFHIFAPLPDPKFAFVRDLHFAAPPDSLVNHNLVRTENFDSLMFFRHSEKDPDSTLQQVHSGRELSKYFPSSYTGHRQFIWMRRHEVWFTSKKPVFIDFGTDLLFLLMQYDPRFPKSWCIKSLNKSKFIDQLISGQMINDLHDHYTVEL